MASAKQVRELLRRLAAGESPAQVAVSAKRLVRKPRQPRPLKEGSRRAAAFIARELGMSYYHHADGSWVAE